MFKLPVCPCCKTVYSYGEVKKGILKKKTCYRCKNSFKPGFKVSGIILTAVFFVLLIILNLTILNMLGKRDESLTPLFTVDAVLILAAYFLLPFTVRFKKIKGLEEKAVPDDSIIEKKPEKKKVKRSIKNRKRKENTKEKVILNRRKLWKTKK